MKAVPHTPCRADTAFKPTCVAAHHDSNPVSQRGNAMPIRTIKRFLFAMLSLLLLSACSENAEYATYEDCLLGEARKSQTPAAVDVVRDGCRGKFPLSPAEIAEQKKAETEAAADAAQIAATAVAAANAAHRAAQAHDGSPNPTKHAASGSNAGMKGSAHVQITPEDYIPYKPADPADVKNGKLARLIERHIDACRNRSPKDLFALFNFSSRYLISKDQNRLAENMFNQACSDEFKFQVLERFENDGLVIASNGKKENGMPATSLCMKMYFENNQCTRGLEISSENNELKWAFH